MKIGQLRKHEVELLWYNTVMGIVIGIIMFAQYPVPLPVRNVPKDSVRTGKDWESVGKGGLPGVGMR